MDFKELEAFVKVIELGSFSKAADDLYLSQPSISNYINSLEKSLDTLLINRSSKFLSTTIEGEKLLTKANEILKLKSDIYNNINNNTLKYDGTIRIIASSVPSQYIIPNLLKNYHKIYPQVNFIIEESDTMEVVQEIANHRADLGFIGNIISEKRCYFKEFSEDKLVFIAPNNGFFNARKEYKLEEILYSHNFISREYGSGTRIQYEKYFQENNINLEKIRSFLTIDNTQSAINAVSNNLGIASVSQLAILNNLNNNKFIKLNIKETLPSRKIYTVINKNSINSQLLNTFLDFIFK